MNTISLRLYPETEARYKRVLDECDQGTNGKPATADQFINYLLECEANPRKVEVSKPEDLARIESLQADKVELANAFDVLREQKDAEIQRLTNLLNQSGVIPPGQILFTVTEAEQELIEQLKPVLLAKGNQGTSEEALYVLIRHHKIQR
jgi:hypothetical protein